MDFIFTQRDLYWLDHLLPDETRRRCEDLAMSTSAAHRYSVTLQMKEVRYSVISSFRGLTHSTLPSKATYSEVLQVQFR